jgi:hypothetical protein
MQDKRQTSPQTKINYLASVNSGNVIETHEHAGDFKEA